MTLSMISRTLDPVSVGPIPPDERSRDFAGKQLYIPTHTLQNAPQLDVLLVPGGLGSLSVLPSGAKADVDDYVAFVKERYNGLEGHKPLQYIISICNGAGLLARAGVLDGRNATGNKDYWAEVTSLGPRTNWIAKARWVNDDNVWTSSGVSAGGDCVLAWMSILVPKEVVDDIVNGMEWIRAESADHDPFAEILGRKDVPPKEAWTRESA